MSDFAGLYLKLYLNSFDMYYRNIFGSSPKVFGNLRKSSNNFENFQKFLENVQECSSGLQNKFGNSSETGRKSSENHQNTVISMFKKNIRYMLVCRHELYVLMARTVPHLFAALTREILFLPIEHKIHIFSPPCNILYILYKHVF